MKHIDKWFTPLASLFPAKRGDRGGQRAAGRRFNPLLVIGLLVLLLFGTRASHAQTATPGWQLLTETSGVKVYYLTETCGAQDVMHLKVQNTTGVSKTVRWVGSIQRSGQDVWVFPSTTQPRSLDAGEEVSGACAATSPGLTIALLSAAEVASLTLHLVVQ